MTYRSVENIAFTSADYSKKIPRFLHKLIFAERFRCLKCIRPYVTSIPHDSEYYDFTAARKWFSNFNRSSIPAKVAKTTYSRASGPGGQKTNKTNSKATTMWSFRALIQYIPKVLHADVKESRYFVSSSQCISIQSDSHRSQSLNEAETHERFFKELVKIYHKRVPGITSSEQKKKVEKLKLVEKLVKTRIKKYRSAKKSLRRCV